MPQPSDILFRTLADPTRRAIFERLCRDGETTVGALTAQAGVSQPAVSKHLRVLENAGLIRRRRCGRVHRLKLEAAPMKQATQWMEEYRQFWEQRLDRLDAYLKELQSKEKKHEHK